MRICDGRLNDSLPVNKNYMKTSQQFNKICSYQGNNFTEWFGDMKFVKNTGKIFSKKLPRDMNDSEILKELNPTEVSLGEIYHYLETEKDHSVWCIFYCKDSAGVLRTVGVCWYGGGWDVGADSVEDPRRWSDGDRVFSRNSDFSPSVPESKTLGSFENLTLRIESLERDMASLKKFLII